MITETEPKVKARKIGAGKSMLLRGVPPMVHKKISDFQLVLSLELGRRVNISEAFIEYVKRK